MSRYTWDNNSWDECASVANVFLMDKSLLFGAGRAGWGGGDKLCSPLPGVGCIPTPDALQAVSKFTGDTRLEAVTIRQGWPDLANKPTKASI